MIYINTIKTEWYFPTISYEQVVILAGKDPKELFTLQFSCRNNGASGTLMFNQGVKVEDKMSFDVTRTNNA